MTCRTLPSLCVSFVLFACTRGEPAHALARSAAFPVLVEARSEEGGAVADVQISSGTQPLGRTDANGRLELALDGEEGDRATLAVHCPTGFASPERPLRVGLRHLSPGSPPPRFEVDCLRLVHTVLVGVMAQSGPHLPILHLQQKVGETDEHGVAHVLLSASNDERLTLTLDTSRNPALRPQNPSLSFVAHDHDEFVLLEHKFVEERARAVRRVRRRGPQPL
jgi:hypothetical protein